MTLHSIFWINLATILVLTIAILASFKVAFGWVFIGTLVGQTVLITLVYRFLKSSFVIRRSKGKTTPKED